LRTFIAIDLPNEILEKIDQIIEYFKMQTPSYAVKWVAKNNLHLTLKFLGEIPKENLEIIKTSMFLALEDVFPFEISIEGLGMFPNARKPRVIWLGITNLEKLRLVHSKLEAFLEKAGVPREKHGFSPHLTIGRVRSNTTFTDVENIGSVLSQYKVSKVGNFIIKEIILYQSELRQEGPLYTPLHVFGLNTV
jgi:2'-5' RNA ligase